MREKGNKSLAKFLSNKPIKVIRKLVGDSRKQNTPKPVHQSGIVLALGNTGNDIEDSIERLG